VYICHLKKLVKAGRLRAVPDVFLRSKSLLAVNDRKCMYALHTDAAFRSSIYVTWM